ncbi:TSC22 domain family protein 2 isoform X1 [Tachysurus fulvidraco]|uniref:TSC22 domain family protein 2 isoform X1 n=1 Tax=Tachysurus fulvidraco TaxID=1234273 RepID=UPI000F4EDE14|nr:TSC22 domain family protein 2 isoform X1 [Tachysurus fulvidraco]
MSAKKKSCFQITSVTQAQVATGGCADDSESLDDPDESRAEDGSSEIYEPEVCERRSSSVHSVGESEAGHRGAQQGQLAHHPGAPGSAGGPGHQVTSNTTPTSCSSRFRVIKLDHGTGEPFRRGRWTCTEFYEREPDVAAGRTSEPPKHATEHTPDRDSGLGASVVVQSSQATDVTAATSTTTTMMLDSSTSHTSVLPLESGNDPPQALLAPGLTQGSHVQISPATPQAYQTQTQHNPHLPVGLHIPSQTSMMPDYGQQHLPHAVPMQGEISMPVPVSQAGASIPNLIDWAAVMAPLAPAPSVQIGPYSGVAMTAGQNSPVLSTVNILVPEQSRRKSDAAASAPLIAAVKESGKPLITEELPLIPNPGVNSLFGIPIPIDGDEDRNPSTLFYKTFQPGIRLQSASGASVVAIDNKIEKAMDLVKSHLMYAVREEVEVLKEQIKELCERNSVLERENAVLKSLANSEQLSQLSGQTAAASTPTQTPASNPQQPSVSSA